MNKEQFHAACEAAFGSNYTTDVAQALNVSDRTVRSWRSGERNIPAGLSEDILSLLQQRKVSTEEAIAMINAQTSRINLLKIRTRMFYDSFKNYTVQKADHAFFMSELLKDKVVSFALELAETEQQREAAEYIKANNKSYPTTAIAFEQRRILADLLSEKITAKQLITNIFNVNYAELFPAFTFTPAKNIYVYCKKPMFLLLIINYPHEAAYRISLAAHAEMIENERKRGTLEDMGGWEPKIISTTINGEIVYVTHDEFLEHGMTETPTKTVSIEL